MPSTATLRMIEGSLERTARTMSANWGVQVVFSGTACAAGGGFIYLPYNSDDLSEDIKHLVHSNLDHETLHVAEDKLAEKNGLTGPTELFRSLLHKPAVQCLFNILEDIRIERKYSALYPGMAENLHAGNVHAGQKWAEKIIKKEKVDFWGIFGAMLILMKRDVDWSFVPKEVQAWIPILQPEIDAIDGLKNHFEVAELSERIYAKICDVCEKLKQPPPESGGKESGEGSGEGDGGENGEGEGKGSEGKGGSLAAPPELAPESKPDDEGKGSPESGEGKAPKPAPGSGGAPKPGTPKPGPVKPGSPKRSDTPNPSKPEPSTPSSAEPKPEAGDGGDSKLPSKSDLEKFDPSTSTPESTDITKDAVHEDIKREAERDATTHERYIPDPKCQALDKWFKPRLHHRAAEIYAEDLSSVKEQVNALRSKLLSALRVLSTSREVGDQRRGVLDAASLHSIMTGNRNLFSSKTKGLELDVCISVLIDLSGSMGPASSEFTKSFTARRVAVALAETFDQLKVQSEFIGFHNNHERMPSISRPHGYRFQGREPFDFLVLKEFGEPLRTARNRFASINGLSDNADGEAVRMVGRRLAARKEKVKMLIVISDGVPCAMHCSMSALEKDLRDAIQELTSAGVVVMGFGILTDSVEDFYNAEQGATNVVITNLDTMTPIIYKAIRDKFLQFTRAG